MELYQIAGRTGPEERSEALRRALAKFDESLEACPANSRTLAWRASTLYDLYLLGEESLDTVADAVAATDEQINERTEPDTEPAVDLLAARVAAARGDHREAVKRFARTLRWPRVRGEFAIAIEGRYGFFQSLLAVERWTDALEQIEACVDAQPGNVRWNYDVGRSATRTGHFKKAYKALAKAAELGYADCEGMKSDELLLNIRETDKYADLLQQVCSNATGG